MLHHLHQQVEKLEEVINQGLGRAGTVLTMMTGFPFEMRSARLAVLPLDRVNELAGGPGAIVVAVYSAIQGDLEGHIMLCLPESDAMALADMLLEQPAGTTGALGAMERSALSEMGNVTCSSVLNTLADSTGLRICLTPPVAVMDMLGAVMSLALADIGLAGDQALVVETRFGGIDHDIGGYLFLLPGLEALPGLFRALEVGR